MYYAYIIKSKKDNSYYYGFTEDLKSRLDSHNSGKVSYTKSHKPFELTWYGAFNDKKKALDFEKYLKSSSGHAFLKKRLV